ncbi:neuromedin-S isoform X2 [Alligator mississippiensis]|uniref:neuromedin-S isoform X2 n=1 Tax=Alligator mississippiensis TaxID=8496 RepID=UPI002877EF66|nr:neuromedin-S isoform X2 [Alligator mississippiensis]
MPPPRRPPALRWLLAACCLCAAPRASGLPQPGARHRHASDLPDSQQLALCFSQWTELNQPQISSSIMDLCNSIFNSMQIAEFLFHYSRAQDSAYPLKNGEQIATAEFTKKDSPGTMGRPFFLFRPRNGRTIEDGGM